MPDPQVQTRERIGDVVIVDQSRDAESAARDAADARLTAELNQGSGFKKFVKSIWKGGMAKHIYRQKYIKEANDAIVASQDVLSQTLANEQERRGAMESTIEQFQSEYDEAIHAEAGEQRERLAESSEIVVEVKKLIRRFADPNTPANERLDRDSLNEEFTRTINAFREQGSGDLKGEGLVQLSNMVEIAQQVESAVRHGEAIDNVMAEFGVRTGESRSSARTDAKYDWVDKTLDKVQSSRIGRILPEGVVIAGVGIAASVASFVRNKAVMAGAKGAAGAVAIGTGSWVVAAGASAALGVGGGAIAAYNERKKTKDERAQHAREMARGGQINPGDKRRVEMEATRYATLSARDETDRLRALIDEDRLDQGGNDALQAALDGLAQVETVTRLSDQRNIDLLSFSSESSVGDERFALDVARAEAKVALRNRLDAQKLHDLGYDGYSLERVIDDVSQAYVEQIDEDISKKDKAFHKLRRRRMLKAGATGFATGATFGLIGQEIGAAFSDMQVGVLDPVLGTHNAADAHNTILNGMIHGDFVHHSPSSVLQDHTVNGVKLHLPEDYNLVDNHDGTMNLVNPNGTTIADHVTVDASHSQAMADALKADGITVDNLTTTSHSVAYGNIHSYLNSHSNATTEVHRGLWYEGNTPKPVFDNNELRMWWGGEANTGITSSGDYSFNIAHMQSNGSFQGNESVDWHNAVNGGTLKLAVSATGDTQSHVFMIDVQPNGEMIIPHDSPAAALFSTENGHAVFHGMYAETVQVTGVDGHGVTQIRPLATVVGDNNPGDIPIPTDVPHPEFKLTPPGYDTAVSTDIAPVLPVVPRRPLEELERRHREPSPYPSPYPSLYGERGRPVDYSPQFMPELRQDPHAKIRLEDGLDWHNQFIRDQGGDAYADEIHDAVDNSTYLSKLTSETKAIVTIPVGAAQESENIYRTLSLYGRQEDINMNEFVVLLHVNWKDSLESDSERMAKIQKTFDEIERARRDYPDLRIEVVESKWSQDKIDRKEYGDRLIGHVSQKMYDIAMAATRNAVKDGRIAPGADLLVIKNDADADGMHKKYIRHMVNALETNPDKDTFTGAIYWGGKLHKNRPGFSFVTKVNEMARMAANLKSVDGVVATMGPNVSMRMSSFAAIGGIGHYDDRLGTDPDDLAIGYRFGQARGAHDRGGGGVPYLSPAGSSGSGEFNKLVVGAAIDSDGSRMAESYDEGRTIVGTWVRATDQNGEMTSRASSQVNRGEEDLAHNPDEVLDYIEENISAMLTHWSPKDGSYEYALNMMIPNPRHFDIRQYDGGETRFTLTRKGRRWLAKALLRSEGGTGQYDPIGSRTIRKLYGRPDLRRRKTGPGPDVKPLLRGA